MVITRVQSTSRKKKLISNLLKLSSAFTDEGYKSMRNQSGIPGERAIEKLQLLLVKSKENSAPQLSTTRKLKGEGFRNTEILEENLNDLLLQGVNTHRTKNAILSNQGTIK